MPEAAVASEEAIATQLFHDGRRLLEAGKLDLACTKLRESAQLAARVGTLGKLAHCEERRGALVAARTVWTEARTLARSTEDPRLRVVEAELARVGRLIPLLLISFPATMPEGVVVRVDGVDVENPDEPLAINPGRHRVEVIAPGMHPFAATILARANGATATVDVPPFTEVAPPPAADAARITSGSSALEIAGLLTAGVGVVGLTAGAFYGGLASGRLEEARAAGCNGTPCSATAASQLADARAAGDVATGLVVAGSVLVAGGVTIWILAPSPDAPLQGVGAAFIVDPRGPGVSLRGAFQ